MPLSPIDLRFPYRVVGDTEASANEATYHFVSPNYFRALPADARNAFESALKRQADCEPAKGGLRQIQGSARADKSS